MSIRITHVRAARVEEVLTNDPVFRALLSTKSVPVEKRDGSTVLTYPEVYAVCESIHADGTDAAHISKRELLEYAGRVLNGQPSVNIPLGIYSLLLSAVHLARVDTGDENNVLGNRLRDLSDEYKKRIH